MFPEHDPEGWWVPDDRLDRMFGELRQLVASWGSWPVGSRPTVFQAAMVLVTFAQALVVKRGRWPGRDDEG